MGRGAVVGDRKPVAGALQRILSMDGAAHRSSRRRFALAGFCLLLLIMFIIEYDHFCQETPPDRPVKLRRGSLQASRSEYSIKPDALTSIKSHALTSARPRAGGDPASLRGPLDCRSPAPSRG